MPAPFKSTVFTGGSFAASGSNGHRSAGLLIYSASRAVNGLLHPVDRLTIGSDIFLYVSGVRGSRGTSVAGTVLIDGDLLVSGTAYDSAGNVLGSGGSSSPVYFTSPAAGIVETTGSLIVDGNLVVQGTTTQIETTNLRVKDPVILMGSGSLGINRNGGIAIASGSATVDQSLVWGRVANDTWGAGKIDVGDGSLTNLSPMTLVPIRASKFDVGSPLTYITASSTNQITISAPVYVELDTGVVLVNGRLLASDIVTASLGFSGSLTRLSGGRSYLAAGSNVTITSESNGQVTISSTGGSGSPGGSNTQVQFNDSGSFGAVSSFSFEKATSTLSITNVTLGGNLDSQAVDARWYLKNNSADALSFWDGSAGSRRFQFNMGDGQERLIAYDGAGFAAGDSSDLEILHDGTNSYIKNSTGTLFISGSTNGVFVTGSAGIIVADGLQPTLTVRASTDSSNQAVLYQESGGDTYLSNQRNSGKLFSSVKTSAGVAVRYLRAIPNAVNYNTIVSFLQGLHDFFDPQANTTDVNFYVGGKVGSKGTSGQRGTALFAGDLVVSGSTHLQGGGSITGSFSVQGSIIPSADSTYTLGTDTLRWGHVYTGDLHLRNERGDWTILEEPDFLCVINNRTGKKYKMMLQPID
jgi:hypothetical protein